MKKYRILFIDDEEEIINRIMKAVNNLLSLKSGYEISYSVLKNKAEIDEIHHMAADIVLFDCALGGAALDFDGRDEATFGVELMRKFRENNSRTKIIFYSGGFTLKGVRCYGFTNEEMLKLINELHIFKMIPKETKPIENAIVEAVNELDAIITSMEDLKEEYKSEGDFMVHGKLYPIDEMIAELKRNSKIGEEFRESVYKTVLTYMMKFGGDEE